MSLHARVASRYVRRTVNRVASRYIEKKAMSLAEAARILGVPVGSDDATINKAYRRFFLENRQIHPDGTPEGAARAKELNIAKDTLTGQLKADRGGPTRPQRTRSPEQEEAEREADEKLRKYKERVEWQKKNLPPVPKGGNLSAAVNRGGFDWKVITSDGGGDRDYVPIENDMARGYWANTTHYILVGQKGDQYGVMRLTQYINAWDEAPSSYVERWESLVTPIVKGKNVMVAAPKVINSMREGAYSHGRTKFSLVKDTLNEAYFKKRNRGTLSFKDAMVGAGLVSADKVPGGKRRVVQIELEPVYNREKWKAWKDAHGHVMNGDAHLVYDWYIVINGNKTRLTDKEVKDLNLVFMSAFEYDYSKSKNITKMKGSRGRGFKMPAYAVLTEMAKHLSGSIRSVVLEQAQLLSPKK